MTNTTREAITQLLAARGDTGLDISDRLVPLLYEELREIAHRELRKERGPRTLRTTELVHEAYLKLADDSAVGSKGRAYFFAAASQSMRRILIERARRRKQIKRGGGLERVTLEGVPAAADFAEWLLDLDRVLDRFARIDPRAAQVVECRFFGGMTFDEISEATQVSVRTVKRDWSTARAWLAAELSLGDV
jgi:RNA polymerase sigma-70 factor (ECF subfamily)